MAQFDAFDVMTATVGTALATNGTITFTYPTKSPARAAASYVSGSGAKLVAAQGFEGNFLQQALGFSLSYGATTVTLTYLGLTTIPVGTQLLLQAPLANGYLSDLAGVGVMQYPFYTALADITAADLISTLKPGFNGAILGIHAIVDKPATTASKLATLTPKVNSTAVTGGALALTSANMTPQGGKVDGAAITALNTFGATDTIGIVGSAVTAFVEGNAWIILDIQNLDTANTLSAITAVLRGREIFPAQAAG